MIELNNYINKNNNMLTKEKVLQSIRDLPNEFSLDDLVEKLILLEKIELGLQQVKDGQTLSNDLAKKKLKKWLK